MFYHYSQNNSGGGFDIDEYVGIGVDVFVEADTAEEADAYAEDIGIYFDGCRAGLDCDCCGDRWYPASEHYADDEPKLYGTPLRLVEPSYYRTLAFIHDKSGNFTKVTYGEASRFA